MDFSPFWISIKVAACATAITFAAGLAAARLVMLMKRGKGIVDGLFSLPMVLPPTGVGFFLLMIFGTNGMLGGLLASIGMSVVFTWQGAVIAAAAVSFPILYRTARGARRQDPWHVRKQDILQDTPAHVKTRHSCGGHLVFCAGSGRIRSYHDAGRKYPRPDPDHVHSHIYGHAGRKP